MNIICGNRICGLRNSEYMYLLAKATQTLPIGTAYPVWTGIGAVGTVLVGILFMNRLLWDGCFYYDFNRLHHRVEDGLIF